MERIGHTNPQNPKIPANIESPVPKICKQITTKCPQYPKKGECISQNSKIPNNRLPKRHKEANLEKCLQLIHLGFLSKMLLVPVKFVFLNQRKEKPQKPRKPNRQNPNYTSLKNSTSYKNTAKFQQQTHKKVQKEKFWRPFAIKYSHVIQKCSFYSPRHTSWKWRAWAREIAWRRSRAPSGRWGRRRE